MLQDDISNHKLDSVTRNNDKFAKAVYTDQCSQMVVMCMKPGDCILKEKHNTATQFFELKSGFLRIEHWTGSCDDPKIINLKSSGCDTYVIPAGDYHRVSNPSESYKAYLVTIYCGCAVHPSCYVKDCADAKICFMCYELEDQCKCNICKSCHKIRSKCQC